MSLTEIIVAVSAVLLVGFSIVFNIYTKKKHGSSCGGACSGCKSYGCCHSGKESEKTVSAETAKQ